MFESSRLVLEALSNRTSVSAELFEDEEVLSRDPFEAEVNRDTIEIDDHVFKGVREVRDADEHLDSDEQLHTIDEESEGSVEIPEAFAIDPEVGDHLEQGCDILDSEPVRKLIARLDAIRVFKIRQKEVELRHNLRFFFFVDSVNFATNFMHPRLCMHWATCSTFFWEKGKKKRGLGVRCDQKLIPFSSVIFHLKHTQLAHY